MHILTFDSFIIRIIKIKQYMHVTCMVRSGNLLAIAARFEKNRVNLTLIDLFYLH